MPSWEHRIEIQAPPATVWEVLADVENWPAWTPSMTRMELLDKGPLRLGSRAHIDFKTVGSSVWIVTSFEAGRGFAWVSSLSGLEMAAGHWIEPEATGAGVKLTVDMRGIGAILLYPFLAWITRRNMRLEAEGLKRACEASPEPA